MFTGDQSYTCGRIPPSDENSIFASHAPKQETWFNIFANPVIGPFGDSISIDDWAVHPFASVTLTAWVPSHKLTANCVLWPLSQAYVYGNVPPIALSCCYKRC